MGSRKCDFCLSNAIAMFPLSEQADRRFANVQQEETMKVWSKPAVREQEVGLEVTSYMPAEIDII